MRRLPALHRRRGDALSGAAVRKADRLLLLKLEETFEETRRRSGDSLACGPGCDDCCHGPFPINRLDMRRLRRGLQALARRDPARSRAIVRRAREAVGILQEEFPGDPSTGTLSGDDNAEERFAGLHARLPCPVLDPDTGRCELYDARPVPCRTYGPPLRFGASDLSPCKLCFDGAPQEEIERCRMVPDPDNLEGAILDGMAPPAHQHPDETFIAFALARQRTGPDPSG